VRVADEGSSHVDERAKLLIIEDDVNLVEALQLYLTTAGYAVVAASNGREGLQQLYLQQPDLIILDIMMPGLDGWEVCNRIREVSDVPIVMLTARGQEAERVRGLQMGADDYVVKPFSLRELEARIESVLRRARMSPVVQDRVVYADEELVIDSERWEVTRRGKPVELTATERRLLFLLAENRGRVVPTDRILERIWGHEYVGEARYVKLYVWRLRQKIEPDPKEPTYIHTERGIGYRFKK
jgi:two-component system KDP operon response regulator KdpE